VESLKYKEYKNIDLSQVGKEILAFWKQKRVFERSVEEREGSKIFTFYEGPPSANGTPGIHHVMARTVKDIFCRYKTMKGYQVKRKGGWDTHGLPVELQVEKELGITKDDIGKNISVAEYNRKCREAVMKYKDQWDLLTEQMGYWVDLERPYMTFERSYMESVWHLLKSFYDKGLLYKSSLLVNNRSLIAVIIFYRNPGNSVLHTDPVIIGSECLRDMNNPGSLFSSHKIT